MPAAAELCYKVYLGAGEYQAAYGEAGQVHAAQHRIHIFLQDIVEILGPPPQVAHNIVELQRPYGYVLEVDDLTIVQHRQTYASRADIGCQSTAGFDRRLTGKAFFQLRKDIRLLLAAVQHRYVQVVTHLQLVHYQGAVACLQQSSAGHHPWFLHPIGQQRL